ncbi:MAG: 1,4-dihydroxy-2-naphthoate polyprenyltransferase [bacterium]|nr:1,4-dihydroxy-2-naphthoate polyprenyltransferase [bacterium]
MTQSRLQVWISAARPKTLWAAVAPVLIGSAMAIEAGGAHLLSALAAGFGAVMIQIGTNFANDYFDFKTGADSGHRLGPVRATQAGLVSPSTMKRATAIAFALAFLAGMYLVYRGGWPIVIVGLLSILFGILYTAGPFPLAYTGLADPFVLIFFGPVAVGGTFFVQTISINSSVLVAGLAPGFFSVAILTVNNLRDVTSDSGNQKKTLAVRFGKTFSRFEYLICIVFAAATPVALLLTGSGKPYSLSASLALLATIPSIRAVFRLSDSPQLNEVLASTGKLLLLYSLLFSLGWLL